LELLGRVLRFPCGKTQHHFGMSLRTSRQADVPAQQLHLTQTIAFLAGADITALKKTPSIAVPLASRSLALVGASGSFRRFGMSLRTSRQAATPGSID